MFIIVKKIEYKRSADTYRDFTVSIEFSFYFFTSLREILLNYKTILNIIEKIKSRKLEL